MLGNKTEERKKHSDDGTSGSQGAAVVGHLLMISDPPGCPRSAQEHRSSLCSAG